MTRTDSIVNDADDPFPASSNSSLWTTSMELGFIGALPPEIITTIFSYVEQTDSLTCMAVCRDWYHVIPQYVRKMWTTVILFSHDAQNKRLVRCLGDHVKSVTFYQLDSEKQVHVSMERLLVRNCASIENLRFIGCTTDHDVFLKLLSRLAPRLTHLKMTSHGSNVDFLHLFKACPMLTHFTYSPSDRVHRQDIAYDKVPFIETSLPNPIHFTRISYLCLDVILHTELRLKPILMACPNLRCFVGPAVKIQSSRFLKEYRAFTVDLDSLFSWCPRITHLWNSYSYNRLPEPCELKQYNIDGDGDGLRYLSQCEDDGRDSITQLLTRNQSTLEHLALRKYSHAIPIIDWSSVFQSLNMPHLRVLDLYDDICYDAPSLVALLNHCPSLEALHLAGNPLVLESSALQHLQVMDRLTILRCFYLDTIDGLTLVELLDRLPALGEVTLINSCISLQPPPDTNRGPANLKRLTLNEIDWEYDGDDMDEAIALFFKYLTGHSKLEVMQLSSLTMLESKSMQAIATIPTLKAFEIELMNGPFHAEDEESYLCELASMLKRTMIEKLKVFNIRSLTYDTLAALGDLPFLQEVHTTAGPALRNGSSTTVNISGLVNMLHNNSSLIKISLHNITMQWSSQVPSFNSLVQLVKLKMPLYEVQARTPVKVSSIKNSFPMFVIERFSK